MGLVSGSALEEYRITFHNIYNSLGLVIHGFSLGMIFGVGTVA